MAVVRNSFASAAALSHAFEHAEDAVNSVGDAFSGPGAGDVITGDPYILNSDSTHVTGYFPGSGVSFTMFGSFGASSLTITRMFIDRPGDWALDVWGNVTASLYEGGGDDDYGASDGESIMIAGAFTRMRYQSDGVLVDIRGSFPPEYPELGSITSVKVQLSGAEEVEASLTGSFSVNGSGDLIGTVTGMTFELNGDSIQVTGISKPVASFLDSNDADAILSSLLSGNDVIYGLGVDQELKGYAGNDVIQGGAGDDTLIGGIGNDTMRGAGGDDVLVGGLGQDALIGGTGADTLNWSAEDTFNGGAGNLDTLKLGRGDLNLLQVANTQIVDIERIDMTLNGANTLKLSAADVLALSTTTDTLTVLGSGADTVDLRGAFVEGATADGFVTYTNGLATVLIREGIDVI